LTHLHVSHVNAVLIFVACHNPQLTEGGLRKLAENTSWDMYFIVCLLWCIHASASMLALCASLLVEPSCCLFSSALGGITFSAAAVCHSTPPTTLMQLLHTR